MISERLFDVISLCLLICVIALSTVAGFLINVPAGLYSLAAGLLATVFLLNWDVDKGGE